MSSSVFSPLPLRPDSVRRSRRSSLNETPRKSGSPAMSLPRSDAIATAIASDGMRGSVLLGRRFRRELIGHAAPVRDHRRVGRGLALPLHARAAGGAEDRDAGDRQPRVDAGPVTPFASDIPAHGSKGSAA